MFMVHYFNKACDFSNVRKLIGAIDFTILNSVSGIYKVQHRGNNILMVSLTITWIKDDKNGTYFEILYAFIVSWPARIIENKKACVSNCYTLHVMLHTTP